MTERQTDIPPKQKIDNEKKCACKEKKGDRWRQGGMGKTEI